MSKRKLMLGDNMESLRKLPDNSVDSIVTDPPYGLSFMNKKWDHDVPSVEFWEEVFRVLKPGGHVLSFGGTRTYHRMVVNIEDAGFEIRDQIMWLYGSGFPKSHNIGKAVDKIQGNEREVVGTQKQHNIKGDKLNYSTIHDNPEYEELEITKGQSKYEGWGTNLKPANEPICVARKPLSEKTIALNVLKWGTGGINIDGCRVGYISEADKESAKPGSLNATGENSMFGLKSGNEQHNEGRFPANIILDEEAGKLLDEQSGVSESKKRKNPSTRKDTSTLFNGVGITNTGEGEYNDKGGASRYFFKASYNFLEQKEYKKKNECQQNNYKLVQYVEQSGLNISQITELIAQTNVEERLKEKLVLLVRSALNLSEKCVMYIVANIVAIATENMASPLTLDFMRELENYILIQNLAYIVEIQDNIDTTPTTQSLMKLFGSVLPVIEKSTQLDQEQEKVGQKLEQSNSTYRFAYQAKVSKKERNMGLDHFEEKVIEGRDRGQDERNVAYKARPSSRANTHPTVKPVALMAYLCRLVTPQGGIVLDPFMGSGSTGIAAQLEGFKFCGMEMSEDYFKIAESRIENYEKYREFIK